MATTDHFEYDDPPSIWDSFERYRKVVGSLVILDEKSWLKELKEISRNPLEFIRKSNRNAKRFNPK